MKKVITNFGVILGLGAAVISGQIRFSNPENRDLAKKIGTNVELTVRAKEPKWKFNDALISEFGSHHYFKSGKQEVDFSIFVYDSPEEAAKQLKIFASGSSVTAGQQLKGFGDEAFYMSPTSYPFNWIGVRKGRILVVVYSSAFPEMKVARRFVDYCMEQVGNGT